MTTTATPTPPPPPDDLPGVTRRHRFSDLYHERTNFQFIKHSRRWAILSATMLLISIVALIGRELNLGIEFEGGTAWLVEMGGTRDANVSDVRDLLEPLGFADSKISVLSGAGNKQVRVQAEVLEDPVQDLQNEVARAAGVAGADVVFTRTDDGGGTFAIGLATDSEVTAESVDAALTEAGIEGADVTLGDDRQLVVTVAELPESPLQQVASALAEYAGADVSDVSISTVGPTWGERVTTKAIQATLVFFLLLAVYLSFRFEWKMAVSAIVAVLHDILISVGVYAVFQFEVTPATVTAFLTILGFSLYDTVVVFDKVRENQERLTATGRSTYPEMVNRSLNAVLMRSLSTSLVALLPVLSLLVVGSLIMGATALEEFAIALAVGLAIGSYSSIYVAAPLLAWWKSREPKYRVLAERRRRPEAAVAAAGTVVAPAGAPAAAADAPGARQPVGVPGPPAVPRVTTPRPRQQRRRKRR